jgi:hypothetical protein
LWAWSGGDRVLYGSVGLICGNDVGLICSVVVVGILCNNIGLICGGGGGMLYCSGGRAVSRNLRSRSEIVETYKRPVCVANQ